MRPEQTIQNYALMKVCQADDEKAAAVALEDVAVCIRPAVRGFLLRKGLRGEDLEDLCSETIARLLVALRGRHEHGENAVPNCVGYAILMARSVYVDYRRQGSPWRAFHICITKILEGPEGRRIFARWQGPSHWLVGFSAWRGQAFRATPRYLAYWKDASDFCSEELGHRNPTEIPLPELIAHLFRWFDTPIAESELVTLLADLRSINGIMVVSLSAITERDGIDTEERIASSVRVEAEVLDMMALAQRGAQIWAEVCQLRPLQRAALLLGMEWDDWLRLSWTPSAVADALTIPLAEMTQLWSALPLSDKAIAARLGIHEAQVSNLRKCARERLRRKLPEIAEEN